MVVSCGRQITKKRNALDYTQRELADKVGVTQKTISKFENGLEEPRVTLLVLLAKALECNVEDLMDDDGEVYFAGTLKSMKNASIGQELTIGAVDENVSKIIMKSGELNSTDIINDDTNKVFKISPAFGGDLVIDEEWIKFRGAELATQNELNNLKDEIRQLKLKISESENK